jgi:hypothetical protein
MVQPYEQEWVMRFFRGVVAGLSVAGVLGVAVPAAAAVSYDPEAKTGFAGAADLKSAFGWDDATLAARAAGVEFEHHYWESDHYDVSCGGPVFEVTHPKVGARYDLTDSVAHADGGYGKAVTGFRITGSYRGVSGTSYMPGVGEVCPDGDDSKVVTSRVLTSSEAGWSLVATSGDESRELLKGTSAA